MADMDPLAGKAGGMVGQRYASFWHDQLRTVSDDTAFKAWIKRGEKVEQRYRDERSTTETRLARRRYNALWSNTEILRPALYGRMPVPIAERRFRDKDPVGRAAAQMLERGLRNMIEICGYDRALKQAVSDYLLPGRGVVWVRYEPEIEEGVSLPVETQTDMRDARGSITDTEKPQPLDGNFTPAGRFRPSLPPEDASTTAPDGGGDSGEPQGLAGFLPQDNRQLEIDKLQQTGDKIVRESTPVDYVPWPDFVTLPVTARTWVEVTAVAKRVYLSRKQAKKRFGNEVGAALPLRKDNRDQRSSDQPFKTNSDKDKCIVWEIWNATDKTVYWVAEGYDYLCDRKEDPLGLSNFFPCPEPLCANPTNNTLIPVPDYMQYQDQAQQIDDLTQRIAMLTKACKVAGVYNAAAKDVQRLMNEGTDNTLIPVDDWAAFIEKGGVEGNLSFLPIEVIKNVINELTIVKQRQIEEMDRLTGINDIMHGTSDARETLGGVRLKANNTGTRLSSRQNEVARFARDVVRIMAEVMAMHFSPQSIIDVSGALYTEGLGPDDMPDLNTLQQAQSGQPPMLPAPQPGMPPAPPPVGGNVVPFPGAQPPALNGQVMPPVNPVEMAAQMEKMQALTRIAKGIELLRNEKLRGFRVDIEVDSTIFPDAAQEKQDRTEFIREVSGFLQIGTQMVTAVPEALPLIGGLLQFGVRGHRVGRDLESKIEEFIEVAGKKLAAMQAKQAQTPNYPELMAAAEVEKTKAEAVATHVKAEGDYIQSQAKAQEVAMGGQMEAAGKVAEIKRQEIENIGEQQNRQADMVNKQIDVHLKLIEKQMEELKAVVEMMKIQNPPPPQTVVASKAPGGGS